MTNAALSYEHYKITVSFYLSSRQQSPDISPLLPRSTGFILEGFPRTADEASFLGEIGLFPDVANVLVVEDSDVIGRVLPPRLDKWKRKRDKKLARRQRMKEKAAKKKVRVPCQHSTFIPPVNVCKTRGSLCQHGFNFMRGCKQWRII